jgi:hypothetical protein
MKRWFVGMAAIGLACGGDSRGPSAASVTGIAGDNQSAPQGTSLPVPLSFTALGPDGLPIEGVSVTWSAIPAAAAAFTPTTGPTGANGVASTNVVLGSTVGQITIRATLAGVSPVNFHAVVLDPCEIITPYTLGQTVSAALTTSDCLRQAWYYDYYQLDLPAGQQNLRLKMRGAGAFDDTFLDLYSADALILAFDDDSILGQEGARNSMLDIILPGDTSYVIGANSFEQFVTGNYTLSSEIRPAAMNGCRQVWVVRGVTVTDSIKATDCADSTSPPKYYDVARVVGLATTVLTLNLRSTTLNPALSLYLFNPGSGARTHVLSNDDSVTGGGTNAHIQYTVPANNFYDIIISTSSGGEVGLYTFEVSASATLSPLMGRSAPKRREQGGWWRDVGLPKRSTQ